jgi:hypothetical protein
MYFHNTGNQYVRTCAIIITAIHWLEAGKPESLTPTKRDEHSQQLLVLEPESGLSLKLLIAAVLSSCLLLFYANRTAKVLCMWQHLLAALNVSPYYYHVVLMS